MPKVSVITPTIRKEGLNVVKNALKNQTYRDFEWLIGSSFEPFPEEERNQDSNLKVRWIPDEFRGGFWSLNRIYNSLFKSASGELIVTWQDWIWAKPDAIEKFVQNVEQTNAVVSGVGDQYEKLNKWGKPEVKIWSDPRKTDKYGSFYEVNSNDAEWNFCAFPLSLARAVGGMDEQLDFLGYGGDQLQISERMDAIGAKFYLDQTNESFTVRHGRDDFGGQKEWDSKHVLFNGKYDQRKQELILSGQWPKLPYLD